jgi:hypothetical protein
LLKNSRGFSEKNLEKSNIFKMATTYHDLVSGPVVNVRVTSSIASFSSERRIESTSPIFALKVSDNLVTLLNNR